MEYPLYIKYAMLVLSCIVYADTQKNILYQNMKLYDDKKGEIMSNNDITLYGFWVQSYIIISPFLSLYKFIF